MILFDDKNDDGPEDERDESTLGGAPRVPRMMVIGVGGGGCNAVNRMADEGLVGVELVGVNTDIQALRRCRAQVRLQLGQKLTRGQGAGGKPEVGRRAALEDRELLHDLLAGVDMVFLAAGMGGGTGTGAISVIAALAVEMGILTIAVVTLPFEFERRSRRRAAEEGIARLAEVADVYLAIENDNLLQLAGSKMAAKDAFSLSDAVLHRSVEGLSDMLTTVGEVNLDFADMRSIMARRGRAVLGIGDATGESRAVRAARAATASPLLADTALDGAGAVLINVSGGYDLTLHEVADAAREIQEAVAEDAEIISGMVIDERFAGSVRVTAVVTGFGDPPRGGLDGFLGGGDEDRGPDRGLSRGPGGGRGGGDRGKGYGTDPFSLGGDRDREEIDRPTRGGRDEEPKKGLGGDTGSFGMQDPAPAPPPELAVPAGVAVDQVAFTMTAPKNVVPGDAFLLDIWAHTQEQRDEVLERARDEAGSEIVHKSKSGVGIARGTVLTVHVSVEGLEVDDPQDTIEWQGEVGNATFSVVVPEGFRKGSARGLATIHAGGLQVAKVHFILQIGSRPAEVDRLPSWESHHRKAFASYSSADRDQVLGRIQGMQKVAPDLEIFLDVASLRSGQYWDQELWRAIPRSDVFYLFWSQNARKSEWVEKEWRCALQTKGLDFIDPVPLEAPDKAAPPAELSAKHFNDWTLAFQRGPQAGA